MTALARRTDPLTSHAAARQMNLSGMALKQREIVLGLIQQYPGHTSLEVAALPKCELDRYQVARRTAELCRDGKIRMGCQRIDRITQRPSHTWWPI